MQTQNNQPWPPGFPRPSNPYAQLEPGGIEAMIRERLATLEAGHRHQQVEIDSTSQAIHQVRRDMRALDDAGRQAVLEIPATIKAAVRPLERRLHSLETRWWEPMRPHLWKVYLGLTFLLMSRIYKGLTGNAIDIIALLELLKG
jgi:uncharacterized coiled-coil protein SlyX